MNVTEIQQRANSNIQQTTIPQIEEIQQADIIEDIIDENIDTNELTNEEVQDMIDTATNEITTNIHEEMKEQEKNIIEQIYLYITKIAQAIIANILKIFA